MTEAGTTATATPEQSSTETAVGSAGTQTQPTETTSTGTWRDGLPPELRSEKSLQSFSGVGDVAKSYVEATRKMGNAVWLPTDKDKPEERQAKLNDILSKLGRPESPDKYGVLPPDIKGGVWSDEKHTEFLKTAHEAGLTKGQAEKMYETMGKTLNGLVPDLQAQRSDTESKLKQEWGNGGYDKHMSYAIRSIKHLGGNDLMTYLANSEAGNNPVLIKAFAKMGQQLAEDGTLPAASEIFQQSEQNQEKLNTILNDFKGPYYDQQHPDHSRMVQEVYRLNQYLSNAV